MFHKTKEVAEHTAVNTVQSADKSALVLPEKRLVKPMRRFTDSASGQCKAPGDAPFSVDSIRVAELEANGLIIRVAVSPEPSHKMAPEPNTKG